MFNTCIYSSIVFLINAIIAYIYKYNTFSILLLLLTISSIYHHSKYTVYSNFYDKIVIFFVISYGLNIFIKKCLKYKLKNKIIYKIIPILTIIVNSLFYFYGYKYNKYCFDEKYGYYFHSLLHIFSSICINSIIIM